MIELIEADAVPILAEVGQAIPATFTSLPDAAEVGGNVGEWATWYRQAMSLTLEAVAVGGAAVIAATDRRADGAIQSKAAVILRRATDLGLRIIWHKIAVNTHGTSLFRPSYSHLIAVGKGKGVTSGKATPDVFDAGPKDYPDALGSNAIEVGLDLLERVPALAATTGRETALFDPFVGRGSILAAAVARGWEGGVGIEIDPAQIDRALAHYGDAATRLPVNDFLWRMA